MESLRSETLTVILLKKTPKAVSVRNCKDSIGFRDVFSLYSDKNIIKHLRIVSSNREVSWTVLYCLVFCPKIMKTTVQGLFFFFKIVLKHE